MLNEAIMLLMAGGPGGQGQGPGGMGQMLVPMLLIFGIFYFMLIRPQQRKEKERKAMIADLKTGERVLFSGGIMGTIANVKEHTFVIKIADGVKIEVARGAVSRVLQKGDKPEEDDNAK
jgi:preprotein translocase subunit YajC